MIEVTVEGKYRRSPLHHRRSEFKQRVFKPQFQTLDLEYEGLETETFPWIKSKYLKLISMKWFYTLKRLEVVYLLKCLDTIKFHLRGMQIRCMYAKYIAQEQYWLPQRPSNFCQLWSDRSSTQQELWVQTQRALLGTTGYAALTAAHPGALKVPLHR